MRVQRLLGFTLAALLLAAQGVHGQEGAFYDVTLLDCHDGDTCRMIIPYLPAPFTIMPVRFLIIDAAEMNGKCEQEKQLAIQARMMVIRMLAEAHRIDLLQVKPDDFFRIDAVVIADGVNVNEALLRAHLAVPSSGTRTQDWCLPLEEIFPNDPTLESKYFSEERS